MRSIGLLLFIQICVADIARRQDHYQDVVSDKPKFDVYYIEHQISEKNATAALRNLTEQFFLKKPAYCKYSVKCSYDVTTYCRSQRFLDDHCCCDHSHGKDKFPWLPHTCYISGNGCERAMGACTSYEERRECCCEKILARDWQKRLLGINSGGLTASHRMRWIVLGIGLLLIS